MSLARKLQVKEGAQVHLVNAPRGLKLDVPVTKKPTADAVVVFVKDATELRTLAEPALAAAREDRLSWIAYPKAGQLGTDLNRDIVWKLLEGKGVAPVRQIALDDVWSALRFRPGKAEAAKAAKPVLKGIDRLKAAASRLAGKVKVPAKKKKK